MATKKKPAAPAARVPAPPTPVQNPERLQFKPGLKRAEEKRARQAAKDEEAAKVLRDLKAREHFSDRDMETLQARETGQLPNSARSAMPGDERYTDIFGDKRIPGTPDDPNEPVFHLAGKPLTPDQVALIGFGNTDEGRERLAAERLAAEQAPKSPRITFGLDEFDKTILRRAELLNQADLDIDARSKSIEQIEAELEKALSNTNPRDAAETRFLPKGHRAKWFGKTDEIEPGYEAVTDSKGRAVIVRDSVLASVPEEAIARVSKRMHEARMKRLDGVLHPKKRDYNLGGEHKATMEPIDKKPSLTKSGMRSGMQTSMRREFDAIEHASRHNQPELD